ncbi:MAG: hypothetical protein NXI23_16320, partial [Bacteroidetes bacterium]|nr:hypothetical protein [Bacteroidota bacterium]
VQFKKLTFSFLNWTPLQNHHLLERAAWRQCSSNLSLDFVQALTIGLIVNVFGRLAAAIFLRIF